MTTTELKPAAELAARSGVHPVSPHLVCRGASDAIAFYERAFGATKMIVLPGPDGKIMHGCIAINGSSVMLVDENPEYGLKSPMLLGGSPVTMHLIVDDVDAFTDKALAAGATVVMPVADMFWGDRYGVIEDPFGHHWSIATPTREPMTEAELQEVAKSAFA